MPKIYQFDLLENAGYNTCDNITFEVTYEYRKQVINPREDPYAGSIRCTYDLSASKEYAEFIETIKDLKFMQGGLPNSYPVMTY